MQAIALVVDEKVGVFLGFGRDVGKNLMHDHSEERG